MKQKKTILKFKNPPAGIIALITGMGIFFLVYFPGRTFYAEYLLGKTILYINNKDTKKAFETIVKAVNTSPRIDRYRITYSNMAIAAATNISQKENISDEDKKNIAVFIQQSINESRAAVSVNPKKITNWDNLAYLYKKIIPYAKGSDTFAIEAFNQAIALDPINPILRISLGQIYYSQNKYNEAVKIFELAIIAKQDFANSYYNLGLTYKAMNQTEKALNLYQKALSLLDANSADYKIIEKEMINIKEKTENKNNERVADEIPETLTEPKTDSIENKTDVSVEI